MSNQHPLNNDLLLEAANSIPIGFVMFDAQECVVVANSTFLSMYGLREEHIGKGTTLVELLRERYRSNHISHEALEEKVTAVQKLVASQKPHDRIDTMTDGRRISVSHRPLPGGGWVGTHENVTEKEEAIEKLRYLAHHDTLTGLKNRTYFWHTLEKNVNDVHAKNGYVALHLFDLDGFKAVNDTHGHQVGDHVLSKVAKRVRSVVRSSDIVVRLGGDEFAIIQFFKKRFA